MAGYERQNPDERSWRGTVGGSTHAKSTYVIVERPPKKIELDILKSDTALNLKSINIFKIKSLFLH